MTLFGKLADGEDGRLMSQNNPHAAGVWMSCFLVECGDEEELRKLKPLSCKYLLECHSQAGDVLISSRRGAGFPEAGG